MNKKEYLNRKFMEKLGKSQVDLDDASIKILILKLLQIEKHLKEVGRQKKISKRMKGKRRGSKRTKTISSTPALKTVE